MLRAFTWLGILALLTLGVALLTARPLVAAGCPGCFGFIRQAPGLYVQSSMPAEQRIRAAAALGAATQRVGAFFGGLQHAPRVLICADDACYHRIGGHPGSGTGTAGSFAVVVSPEAINTVPMAEALAQLELHGRVGYWRELTGAVPIWFDQGVAVLAADDTLYIRPRGGRDRCLAGPIPDMPVTPEDWNGALQEQGQILYARAACQTDMWMESHGGPAAVAALLAKVAVGQSFDSLYKP